MFDLHFGTLSSPHRPHHAMQGVVSNIGSNLIFESVDSWNHVGTSNPSIIYLQCDSCFKLLLVFLSILFYLSYLYLFMIYFILIYFIYVQCWLVIYY